MEKEEMVEILSQSFKGKDIIAYIEELGNKVEELSEALDAIWYEVNAKTKNNE